MNLNRLVELRPIFGNQEVCIELNEYTTLTHDSDGFPCKIVNLADVDDHYVIETDDEQYVNLPKPFYIAIWKWLYEKEN